MTNKVGITAIWIMAKERESSNKEMWYSSSMKLANTNHDLKILKSDTMLGGSSEKECGEGDGQTID